MASSNGNDTISTYNPREGVDSTEETREQHNSASSTSNAKEARAGSAIGEAAMEEGPSSSGGNESNIAVANRGSHADCYFIPRIAELSEATTEWSYEETLACLQGAK